MSAKNLEVVRGIYERWACGDFRAGTDLFDPWVLLVLRPDFLDSGAHLGSDGIRNYMRGLLDAWDPFTIEGKAFLDAGDSVMVDVHQVGTGRESGTPVDFHYFQVWTFRGAAVIRIESIYEREDALEAVGLPVG